MDIPDFMTYYLSAQAHYVYYWIHPPKHMPHVAVEHWLADPVPLEGCIYGERRARSEQPSSVTCTVDAWHRILQTVEPPVLYSPLLPLSYHPQMPLLQEQGFQTLCRKVGVTTWGDLFHEHSVKTRDQFARGLPLSSLDVFYYVRLRQGLKAFLPAFPSEPNTLMPLHQLLNTTDGRHLVSRLYHSIHDRPSVAPCAAKAHWELDLATQITDIQWQYCCQQTARISASSRMRVIHYRYLQRLYCTPTRKFRFKLASSDCCERCGQPQADFFHLAWVCPQIHEFWSQVLAALEDMTSVAMRNDPLMALLGYTAHIPVPYRKYVNIALLLAKRRVACRWGRGRAPKFKMWLADLVYCQDQLKIYGETLPNASRPRDIWGPLQIYLLQHGAGDTETTPT